MFYKTRGSFCHLLSQGYALRWEMTEKRPLVLKNIVNHLLNRANKINCELMLTYDTPANMFNVHKNQLSRQTESRNLTGPKSFSHYGIPIWSFLPNIRFLPSIASEKNVTKNILGQTDRRAEVKQYTHAPLPPSGGSGV